MFRRATRDVYKRQQYTYIRNFDIRANTVSLTEAKIVLSHDPGWFGFRTDIGLGSVFQVMHQSGNPTGTGLKYVEQMYVCLLYTSTVAPARQTFFCGENVQSACRAAS